MSEWLSILVIATFFMCTRAQWYTYGEEPGYFF